MNNSYDINAINDFNNTNVKYPKEKTIVQLFEEEVENSPDKVAVVFKNEQVTYGELNERANGLAVKLREMGVKPNDFVAMICERSIEMIVGIYGIIKAGGAYVPIDPSYPEERIQYILSDCKAKVIVTYGATIESEICVIDLSCKEDMEIQAENLQRVNNPEDLIYLIYTSGTTGKPKGVMIEHRNVVRLFVNDDFKYDFNADDVWTMFHSYCFDFSVWETYGATLFGGKLIVLSKEEVKDSFAVMDIIKNKGVTVLNQVPSAFYNLLDADSEENELKLRYLIFGGESLKPQRLLKWYEWHPKVKIVNMYGITETTVHATYREIGKKEIENGISDIGKAIPTLSIHIMNGNSLCEIGVPGEICIAGTGVARGYLNNPELTEKRFVDNMFGEGKMYRSGDLGKWLPDGNIEYIGRADEQVKIRGFRIELGEIDSAIRKIDEVKDVAVIVRENKNSEKEINAYIISENSSIASITREELKEHLPEYMIPAKIMKIDSFPVTSNGKLDKKALPEIKELNERNYVAPTTPLEEEMVQLWGEMLSMDSIGIDDNFIELGGHSLIATKIVHQINQMYDINLSIIEFLTDGLTIRTLSQIVEEKLFDSISDDELQALMNEIYTE